MTNTAPKIFQWRNQVKADRRLRAIDFLVAYQLSERTNAGEFGKFGCLITWQGIASMAAAIGVSDRTVQRSIRRLQAKPRHLEINPGGGRNRSNRYTLVLHSVQAVAAVDDKAETVTAVSPFMQNGDTAVRVFRERVTDEARKGDNGDAKGCQPCHPNPYIESFSNPSANRETDDRGPLGLEGRGPHPLGELEPDLRRRLGKNFKLLSMAKLVERSDQAVRLSVLTPGQGDTIRKHCEADILEVSGASKLEFEFAIAVEPPPLRRLQ